jgi:hypothetical protein
VVFKEPHKGKNFSKRGMIRKIRKGGRSYKIKGENGYLTNRNNKYVRRALSMSGELPDTEAVAGTAVTRAIFSLMKASGTHVARVVSCLAGTRQSSDGEKTATVRFRKWARVAVFKRSSSSETVRIIRSTRLEPAQPFSFCPLISCQDSSRLSSQARMG